MNHDFISTLRDHVSKLGSDPITDGESSLCATIEGTSKSSHEPFWIQLHAGQINFPHIDTPDHDVTLGVIFDAIENLGDVDLEPGAFVTFAIDRLDTATADRLIGRILGDYFDAEDELSLATATL